MILIGFMLELHHSQEEFISEKTLEYKHLNIYMVENGEEVSELQDMEPLVKKSFVIVYNNWKKEKF